MPAAFDIRKVVVLFHTSQADAELGVAPTFEFEPQARIIKDDFLQQNSFTAYDKFCPFYKSSWMLRNMVHFFDLATAAVEKTASLEGPKITLSVIKARLGKLIYEISAQKFQDPADGKDAILAALKQLHDSLTASFAALEDEYR